LEAPHAHHQYEPGAIFCTNGDFWVMIGSAIIQFGFVARLLTNSPEEASRAQTRVAS
jgi:hypothetical protein